MATSEAGALVATATGAANLQRNSLLLTTSSVAVGIGNYGFNLALVWLLPSVAFSQVASASALLLIVGTVGAAALPLLVARTVLRTHPGSPERQDAVGFALAASVVLGLVIGLVMAALASPYAPSGILVLLVVTSVALIVASVGSGYLVGCERFSLLAVVSVAEMLVKLGAGIGLAVSGGGATGAFAGSAFGAVMWAAVGVWIVRKELRWPRTPPKGEVWRQLGGTGGIQALISVLTTMDVVVGSIVLGGSHRLAPYQAMLVFARVPLFVSNAISGVVYPRLVSLRYGRSKAVSEAMLFCSMLTAVGAAAVATLPPGLLRLFLPDRYLHSLDLLLPLAIAGFAVGLLNLSGTFLQGDSVFGPTLRLLAVAGLATIAAYAVLGTSPLSLAWCAAVAMSLLAARTLAMASRRFGPARLPARLAAAVAVLAASGAALRATRDVLPAWLALAAVFGLAALAATRPVPRRAGPLRVLFLAAGRRSEDRFWPVLHALTADGVDVTVGFAALDPDAPVLDGLIRYDRRSRHPGRPRGGVRRLVLALWLLHRYRPDLVVEEVRMPYVDAAAPWWHHGAAVALVQRSRSEKARSPLSRAWRRRILVSYEQVLGWTSGVGGLVRVGGEPVAVPTRLSVLDHGASPLVEVSLDACRRALRVRGSDPGALLAGLPGRRWWDL